MAVMIQEIYEAVWQLKKAKALEFVKQAIADGLDLPWMHFIEKAQEHKADIIGLSAFLVTTIPYVRKSSAT